MHSSLGRSWILLSVGIFLAADEGASIRVALTALQRGDFAEAEKVLRPEVNAHPNDAGALTLLAVALDKEKKFPEAELIHRRAVASAPNSPDVWNNYANHRLTMGDESGAANLYRKVVAIAPANYNADIQLARLEVKAGRAGEALSCLDRLEPSQQNAPNVAPLRIAALHLAGQKQAAEELTSRWLEASKGDLGQTVSIGLAAADLGNFQVSEAFLNQALTLDPSDITALSNLGIVEWRLGNYQRAREVLEAARSREPENVDLLYTLAAVDHESNRNEPAVELLASAARLAPLRSDVQKLLAMTTGDLGALDDSAAAWERYIRLEPGDDVGRRERGFTNFKRGLFEQALADVQWFVARHPKDAVGHFELGAMLNKDNPAQALREYDRAVELKPDFAAARSERGSLYYQMGKPETALPDLEAAVSTHPDDPVSLDRLGQTYSALDRPADAVRVLRRATTLSPDDSKMQLHLARALADAGDSAESKAAMDRFRQLGPDVKHSVPGGLVDYLSLTPAERQADYRRRVERLVHQHPEDVGGELDYLQILLDEGDLKGSAQVAATLIQLKAPATDLARAGRALLAAGQYRAARELLQQAALGHAPGVPLDLALAAFRESGPAEGLRLLDAVAEPDRNWSFYLARAEMLDDRGDSAGAKAALALALANPKESSAYIQTCLYLLRKGKTEEADQTGAEALTHFPQDRRVLLLRALTLEFSNETEAAQAIFEKIENRWPEWPAAWAEDGILLEKHQHHGEAVRSMRTAIALGADLKELKDYFEALSAGRTAAAPDPLEVFGRLAGMPH